MEGDPFLKASLYELSKSFQRRSKKASKNSFLNPSSPGVLLSAKLLNAFFKLFAGQVLI